MAYRLDSFDNAIVIDGFEAGIGDSEFSGLGNLQNINIASVPGEANVGFSTVNVASYGTITTIGTVTSVASNYFAVTGATGLSTGMAISFGTVSNFNGFSAGTQAYWITLGANGTTAFTISAAASQGTVVTVTGSGTANFTIYTPAQPKYITQGSRTGVGLVNLNHFMVDANGLVWSDKFPLGGGSAGAGLWAFLGNSVKRKANGASDNGIIGHLVNDQSQGNGMVYYNGSDGKGWLFVFSSSSIDYWDDTANTWTYGWKPSDGTVNNSSGYLTMAAGEVVNTSHFAFIAPDGNVYFCDQYNVRKFFQTDKVTPTAFVPTSASTFTYQTFNLLPFGVFAQCLANLGVNILIGGSDRFVYQWDTFSNQITYPIQVPESNIVSIISVDVNAYIFAGNRGRIYITNGTQAQLFKKIPDHISNTVEPYFVWGGSTVNKNQIYFSLFALDNAQSALNFYGGVWAINLDTKAIRLTNQLSYGSYAGYASALMSQTGDPAGYGLYIGWNQTPGTFSTPNTSAGAIDQTTSNPYTNSVALVDTDLIPIGTFEKPRSFQRVEYLLTKPLVAGESIKIQYRQDFSQSFADIGTDSTVGNYTNSWNVPFGNVQWIQLRAILNSTTTSPSYVRLKHLRLTGLVGPTMANSEQLSA